jgi:tRNA (mo5U34)-methyltransferase
MEQDRAVSRDWIAGRIRELGPWFHNIDLAGVPTAPDHFLGDYPSFKWRQFQHVLPQSLEGMTVLDIGCNAGFYSCEMKRRGADRVVAIDSDTRYLHQAELVAEVSGLEIDFREMSVYDIGSLGERFDLVIFMGVLYHLRHPLLALDLIYEHVAKDYLLYQSMERGAQTVQAVAANYPFEETAVFADEGYPRLYFIEHRYADDPTNWWIPNRACSEAMLRSAGFVIEQQPDEEIYWCRRGQRHKHTPPPPVVCGAEQSRQKPS